MSLRRGKRARGCMSPLRGRVGSCLVGHVGVIGAFASYGTTVLRCMLRSRPTNSSEAKDGAEREFATWRVVPGDMSESPRLAALRSYDTPDTTPTVPRAGGGDLIRPGDANHACVHTIGIAYGCTHLFALIHILS